MTFVALFEALNWLDALRLHSRAELEIDSGLNLALKFVRGRVHHTYADAIEFRRDILLPLDRLGTASAIGAPIVVADWCWRPAQGPDR